MSSIKIIGIGLDHQGDDAAGLLAVRKLKEKTIPGVEIVEASKNDVSLLELWDEADTVFIIDASCRCFKSGSICRRDNFEEDRPRPELPGHKNVRSCICDTMDTGLNVNLLPPNTIVYGINGEASEPGTVVSANVSPAIDEVVQMIVDEVEYIYDEQEVLSQHDLD